MTNLSGNLHPGPGLGPWPLPPVRCGPRGVWGGVVGSWLEGGPWRVAGTVRYTAPVQRKEGEKKIVCLKPSAHRDTRYDKLFRNASLLFFNDKIWVAIY